MLFALLILVLLALAAYSFIIYPICLLMVRSDDREEWYQPDDSFNPPVDVVVTCYEEGGKLYDKLHNLIHMDSKCRMIRSIIVIHDGCASGCPHLEDMYEEFRKIIPVKSLVNPRLGKETAQLRGIKNSKADIIFFTDVSTVFDAETLPKIVKPFQYPHVGAVSTTDNTYGDDESVSYEIWIRDLESDTRAGLVGLSGSGFAVRRGVIEKMDNIGPSDMLAALYTKMSGMKAVQVRVDGCYPVKTNGVYRRRVRTSLRGMNATRRHWKDIRNMSKMWKWQFKSHKVMRWLSPWFVALAVFLMLLKAPQVALLLIISVPILLSFEVTNKVIKDQLAVMEAGIRFLSKQEVKIWNPSRMDLSRNSNEPKATIKHPNW